MSPPTEHRHTLLDTLLAHPYLTSGALLGTAGLTAGALAARRALGLRGAYTSRYAATPKMDLRTLTRHLQPGDILVDSKHVLTETLPQGMTPLQRMIKRIQNLGQEAVQGDARHASIYVGNDMLVHMTPNGLIHEPVGNIAAPGSTVVRPNLPRQDREAAAAKALKFLDKPMAYDWEGMPRTVLNRFMPVACAPGDARICSSMVADAYGNKVLVPTMENKLVTPADLVASPHVSPIGRTRERAVKQGAYAYDVGADAAADRLSI